MKIGNLQKDSETIGWRWVFCKKENKQYKTILVANGYAQKEGIDYNQIFSLVVKLTFIRMFLAMVAQFDLELEQMDVKTTFVHDELEEIYMMQPEGLYSGKSRKQSVFLTKSLYGLKYSLR